MPHESPSNNEPEGSKDGRQWTNAEIFAFVGFLNDERHDGALQNTTTKFVALTLKKASDVSPRLCGNFSVIKSLAFLRLGATNFVVVFCSAPSFLSSLRNPMKVKISALVH
ncbi:hypothetical protein E4U48_005084 [Claviceps purpurea]|nr:hypothetical protein E4U48_005084 [Claviceps purpurea]